MSISVYIYIGIYMYTCKYIKNIHISSTRNEYERESINACTREKDNQQHSSFKATHSEPQSACALMLECTLSALLLAEFICARVVATLLSHQVGNTLPHVATAHSS